MSSASYHIHSRHPSNEVYVSPRTEPPAHLEGYGSFTGHYAQSNKAILPGTPFNTAKVEAASARMAARDRFSGLGDPAPSPLQRYIQRACDPGNIEPDLALDLDIAELINTKKGNAPREAAVAIVNYINARNQHISLLALTLLDICVKNCGYPFHLQISTKEFLNELVRRFPERPPIRPTRVQLKILEAIEEWRQTICQTSRYKGDLGFIRDMHSLLIYKGYMFPEVRRDDASVLNPNDNLKSAEEMEEEERAAQKAKLQELVRRGGPEDLQEANKLMKVLAGYDTRNKTDYRAKAAEEVSKVQQKAKILEEMLQGYKQGDMMAEGDVFQELANALQSAQPKIQKMCEEESDDAEAVAKLLEINDSIHRTVERYKLVKKGDLEGAAKIPKGTLGTSTGVSKNAANELSLIDFDAESEQTENGGGTPATAVPQKPSSIEDDLLGLSMNDSNYGQSGGISLGFAGANASNWASPPSIAVQQPLEGIRSPSNVPTPLQQTQLPKPNYSPFASLTNSHPQSQTTTPNPLPFQQQTSRSTSSQQQIQQWQQQQQPQQQQAANDPFSAFASSTARQASPYRTQPPQIQATPPPVSTPAAFEIPSQQRPASELPPLSNPAASIATLGQNSGNNANDSEEWTFASALPVSNPLPASNDLTVLNKSLNINLVVTRPPLPGSLIMMMARFSNNTEHAITELTFQVAVTKGFSLRMEPQSGRTLQPNTRNGITQVIHLNGVERGKGNTVKMRWKVSYKHGVNPMEEQGEIPALGVQ